MKNFIDTYKSYFIGSLLIIIGSGLIFGIIIGTFPTSRTITRSIGENIFMTMKYSSVIWLGITGLVLGIDYLTNSHESREFSRNVKQIFKK